MKLLRKVLAPVLAALIAVPAPAAAQTIRIALDTPLTGAPAVSAPMPFALSAPALSAPSLAPMTASFPVLSAPVIPTALTAAPIAPIALTPIVARAAAKTDVARPRTEALIAAMHPAPSLPDSPVEERKAAADAQFDGSVSKEESSAVAAEQIVSEAPRLDIPDLDQKISKLGRVPAPRPWIEKGKVLLAYGGLTASAVSMHAPFDRIAPLVIGVVMAVAMAPIMMMFYAAGQSVAGAPEVVPAAPSPNDEAKALAQAEPLKPSAGSLALIARLAVEAKVPPPARVNVMHGDKVQAQVGGGDEQNPGYEIRYTKAFESLRPEVQEAIMRHEYAHRRHHDGVWSAVTMFLSALPTMIALLGMTDKPDVMGWLAGAIAATSVLLFPVSMQHSEYLADQYAASKPEGAGPLARFFVEDSEKPERAASALTGKEFSSETGWRRRAIMFWDSLRRVFSAHPSHDRRVARLVRLAAKAAAERRK